MLMDSSPSSVPSPPRRRSLRAQLTLLVAAVIIVPAVSSGLLLGLGARHTIREEIFRFIDAVSILGAQSIERELAHYQETLNRYRTRESLTRYIRELSEMPPAARRELLRRRMENQLAVLTHPSVRVYRPMLVLSPEGRLLGWSGLSAAEAQVRARRYNPEVLRRAGPAKLTPAYLEPSRRLVAVDVIAAVQDPASAGRSSGSSSGRTTFLTRSARSCNVPGWSGRRPNGSCLTRTGVPFWTCMISQAALCR